jgi:hypothetical protein
VTGGRNARFSRASFRWLARVEIRVLSSVEIMRAIVDRIGCKLNVLNEDGVYRRDRIFSDELRLPAWWARS